jgi:hypothetical protein
MKLDPRVSQGRLGYAMALADLKRYQEARAQLIEGEKIYPGQPEFADAMAHLPD